MKRKPVLIIIIALVVIGIIAVIILFNKPHARVEDQKSLSITAVALADAFTKNETTANKSYLNKAIEVTGQVAEVSRNQDGGVVVLLRSGDPAYAIQCAMRDKNAHADIGKDVTIVGFCSGNDIVSVILTDCIIK